MTKHAMCNCRVSSPYFTTKQLLLRGFIAFNNKHKADLCKRKWSGKRMQQLAAIWGRKEKKNWPKDKKIKIPSH